MRKIELTEQDIKDLEVYLGEIPYKYALPIFEFLGKKIVEKDKT